MQTFFQALRLHEAFSVQFLNLLRKTFGPCCGSKLTIWYTSAIYNCRETRNCSFYRFCIHEFQLTGLGQSLKCHL